MLHKASRYEAYVIIGRKSVSKASGYGGLGKGLGMWSVARSGGASAASVASLSSPRRRSPRGLP